MVVCTDLKEDIILGVDFLIPNQCVIDYKKQFLRVAGCEVPLIINDGNVIARISVKESVVVPAGQEVFFKGKSSNVLTAAGILEATETFLDRSGLILARVLAAPQGGEFPVRVFNPSNQDVLLRENTALGNLYSVSSITSPFEDDNTERKCTAPQFNIGDQLNFHERSELHKLLLEYQDVFSQGPGDLGRFHDICHEINTGDASPTRKCPYRVPGHLRETVKEQVQTMLKAGVIEESCSPWASPILLVKKKNGEWRFCVDFRALNSCTKKDSFPIPRTDDTLDALSGAKLFSVVDMASGYWQAMVHPRDREKTAFVTSEGLYQFRVLPYGLCNGPSTYQRMMQYILSGLTWKTCLIYLDDVIIFAPDFATHQARLREVLNRIREANLKLQPAKCKFACTEVLYLGHLVSSEGIFPDPSKIQAVREYPRPKNLKQVQSFLGLCSYYRRFISNFAQVARPLHRLTHKDVKFTWNDDCEHSFHTLITLLTSPPILAYPDYNEPFLLATDASGTGLGAVLSQVQDGREKVVCFASKLLTKAERNYSTIERETLALIWATELFKPYLYGKKFTFISDHNPLRWLRDMKEPKGKFARWIMKLEEFEYEVVHKSGKTNQNADALSRSLQPVPDSSEATGLTVEKTKPLPVQAMHLQPSHTTTDWGRKQLTDPVLRDVLNGLSQIEWARPLDGELRSYWRHRKNLQIENGILIRVTTSYPDGARISQLLVPRDERNQVMELAHDNPLSGHLGATRTLERVKEKFYWVGIASDVEKWCRECRDCATKKPPPQYSRGALQSMPQATKPFEMLAMDFVGPLKTTKRGNKYILVVTDYFSRWPEAFALPNQEAETVASTLMEHVVSRFGLPLIIMTDQGRNFESRLFRELCHLLGVQKLRTSAYHPMSNGLVENCNKTIITELSMYTNNKQDDWDEWLPHCLFAYRTSRHETLGFAPSKLVLTYDPKVPLDLMKDFAQSISTDINPESYIAGVQNKIRTCFETACKRTSAARANQKNRYDGKGLSGSYEVDDRVWLYNPATPRGLSSKLHHHWTGPFTILEKLSPVTYKIRGDHQRHSRIVHHNRLKKCFSERAPTPPKLYEPPLLQPRSRSTPDCAAPKDALQARHIIHEHIPEASRASGTTTGAEDLHQVNPSQTEPSFFMRSQRRRQPPDRYGDFVTH